MDDICINEICDKWADEINAKNITFADLEKIICIFTIHALYEFLSSHQLSREEITETSINFVERITRNMLVLINALIENKEDKKYV